MPQRRRSTIRICIRLTDDGLYAVRTWAEARGVSCSAALESLARLGLGQSTDEALAPALVSVVRVEVQRQMHRFASLLPLAFRYAALLDQLAEDGETDTGFGVVGSLTVAADATEASRMPVVLARMEERRAAGVALIGQVAWVDPAQARALFPLLTERMQGGAIYASGAARVDGRLLLGALRRAAERRGARTLQGLADVVTDDHQAVGVRVNGELREASAVLIAVGSLDR